MTTNDRFNLLEIDGSPETAVETAPCPGCSQTVRMDLYSGLCEDCEKTRREKTRAPVLAPPMTFPFAKKPEDVPVVSVAFDTTADPLADPDLGKKIDGAVKALVAEVNLIPTPEGMKTPAGVQMSPRLSRCYGWLNANQCPLTPFSTDSSVASMLPRIDAAISKAEALPENTLFRADLIADLTAVRSRTPQARVETLPSQLSVFKVPSQGLIAVETAGETTGAVVYWTLRGALNLNNAKTFWAEQGLPVEWLPAAPSPQVAFSRAVKAQQTRTTLVRRHPDGGYQFTYEYAGEKQNDPLRYETGPRLFLKQETSSFGAKTFGIALHEGSPTEGASRVLDSTTLEYDRAISTVDSDDMGTWFVWICKQLGAVSLRQTGGIYFVPKDKVETFHKIKACITSASSHRVFEIPAMKSEEAIEAVFASVIAEIDAASEVITGALQAQEMGSRAAKSRRDDLAELADKVRGYEKLLGKSMKPALDNISALDKKLADYTPRASLLEVD